jgi:hypothetical protein
MKSDEKYKQLFDQAIDSIEEFKEKSNLKDKNHIENYFMQATAYSEMFEERTGLPIEQIVVAIANEEGKPQIFIREKCNYVSKLNEYIGNYWNNA